MRANRSITSASFFDPKWVLTLVTSLLGLALVASGQPSFGPGGPALGGPADLNGQEVKASASAQFKQVPRGSVVPVVVVLDHAKGWHSWPAEEHHDLGPGFEFAIRTSVELHSSVSSWASQEHATQWPELYEATVADPSGVNPEGVKAMTYHDRALIYLPVTIAADAPIGQQVLIVTVGYQACDDRTCQIPEDIDLEIPLTIVESDGLAVHHDEALADFDGLGPLQLLDGDRSLPQVERTEAGRSFFGIPVPSPTSPAGVIVIALLAALGGAVLNLTPCVLPVIPIKIMTISAHANSPGKSLVLGLWMALGVVAFWAGLGVLAASFSAFADPSRLFGIWWVTAGIGLLIGAMGVGIMGAFEIKLPKAIYAVNPKADSPTGSFGFGIMTAILGLPCFGFVAGALLAGSATLHWAVVMTIFVAMGVGMALPYLILSASPKLVKRIPKTGPGSELVKQVMGLLLLAAAAYFVGSGIFALLGGTAGLAWWAKSIHWWVIGVFSLGAGVWLAYRTFRIAKSMVPKAAMAFVGLIIATGGVAAAVDRSVDAYNNFWVSYDQVALDDARRNGNVVVLDFTAEWCLNCKALKAAVLSQNPVKPVLQGTGVIPMTVDLTSRSAPGWDKLRELGQTGIPLLVIYGPGTGDEPWMANNYTQAQVMAAIEAARGSGRSSRASR